MPITELKKWQTSDGKEFDVESHALFHEKSIEIKGNLYFRIENFWYHDMSLTDLVSELYVNRKSIIAILSEIDFWEGDCRLKNPLR